MRALLALPIVMVLSASAQAQPFQTPQAVIEGLYAPYLSAQAQDANDDPQADTGDPRHELFYSDRLSGLVAEYERKSNGEAGDVDFDWVVNAQDYFLTDFKISDVKIAETTAIAFVRFSNLGEETSLRYDLIKENGNWQIDDTRCEKGSSCPWALSVLLFYARDYSDLSDQKAAAEQVQDQPFETPRALLEAVYKPYQERRSIRRYDAFYSDALMTAFHGYLKTMVEQKSPFDWWDPFLDGYNHFSVMDFKMDVDQKDDQTAVVQVWLTYGQFPVGGGWMRYHLVNESPPDWPQIWQIDDIDFSQHGQEWTLKEIYERTRFDGLISE